MSYVRDYQLYALLFLAFAVPASLLYATWTMSWEQRSHVASTISALAVILALLVAGSEYLLHHKGDQDRKKQAVVDIQRVTIGLERLDKAYAALFDFDPEEVLQLDPKTFDERIASLSDVFWAVGGCAAAQQCDEEVTRAIFCHDFLSYKHAYIATHKDRQYQDFKDSKLAVFKACPDEHRFKK